MTPDAQSDTTRSAPALKGPADQATPGNGTRPVIETRSLAKHYGHVVAVEDVDFSLSWGEIHAIVGDNGAGKSTFIKMLAGAVKPSSGDILLEGDPCDLKSPQDALELGIATIHQDLALVGCRSIEDNLFLGHEPVGMLGWVKRKQMRRESWELLSALRQLNFSNTTTPVDQLSGGQRQAVAIARGIRLASRVLILDEPTAALGVREAHQILTLIGELKSPRRAIVIISHNLAHVFRLADRITVFRSGRAVGTVVKNEVNPDAIVKMITGAEAL